MTAFTVVPSRSGAGGPAGAPWHLSSFCLCAGRHWTTNAPVCWPALHNKCPPAGAGVPLAHMLTRFSRALLLQFELSTRGPFWTCFRGALPRFLSLDTFSSAGKERLGGMTWDGRRGRTAAHRHDSAPPCLSTALLRLL